MPKVSIAAGRLDKRVTLQQPVESVDAGGYGDVTPAWTRVSDLWASIETQGGREFYRASQVYSQLTHLVTIRYRVGVTTKMRLKFRSRYLYILGIVNPEQHDVLLQLACAEAV